MTDKPLVSVIIPTKNSERTLKLCLQSIRQQTYHNIEVIVVDCYSNDSTVEITIRSGGSVIYYGYGLLGARHIGFIRSKGQFALLLDSDQILERTAIERAVKMASEGYDALCFEERSYLPKTFVQRLFESDRIAIHRLPAIHLDSMEGVLLARFYKRKTLEITFKAIPSIIFPIVVARDHDIIYFEACKISKRIGILTNAVWHVEPAGLVDLWNTNYRYGRSSKALDRTGFYRELLKGKLRFRRGVLNQRDWKLGIQSYLLLALKGIAFEFGYITG
jgi:glycosyltransferase involved in cell wall biosynthesis